MALTREQSLVWEAMGIGPQWILRSGQDPLLSEETQTKPKAALSSVEPAPAASVRVGPSAGTALTTSSTVVATPTRKPQASLRPVQESPVTAGSRALKPVARVQSTAVRARVEPDPVLVEQVKTATWEGIAEIVARCEVCPMSKTRTQTVCADGAPGCPVVIVGEAPGRDEDIEGVPFVGKSGRLLTTILDAVGLKRGVDVAIVNVLKCRPLNNRDPLPEETQACRAFLDRQLELLAPRVLILMGRHAMAGLLPESAGASIGRVRGKVHHVTIGGRSVPTVVSYHPSYLLRNPVEKEKSWHDLLQAKRLLDERS